MKKKTTRKVATVLLATTVATNGFAAPVLADTGSTPDGPATGAEFTSTDENEAETIREATDSEAQAVPENVQSIIDSLGGNDYAEYVEDTIRLKNNATPSAYIMISDGKDYTINLNGHEISREGTAVYVTNGTLTLTGSGKVKGTHASGDVLVAEGENAKIIVDGDVTVESTGTEAARAIAVNNGGDVTIQSGTVTGQTCAVAVLLNGSLHVNGGIIGANGFAIAGNGTTNGTTIEINGGSVSSETAAAIYHPQNGTMTIGGNAVIEGPAGIVARAGEITVSAEATVRATGSGKIAIGDATPSEVPAAAIAADQNGAYNGGNVKVTVSGGKIEGPENGPAVVLTKAGVPEETVDHAKFDITGGEFLNTGDSFAKYVDDECAAAYVSGGYTYVRSSLQEAADAIGVDSGDVLTVVKAADSEALTVADGVQVENESDVPISVNDSRLDAKGGEHTHYPIAAADTANLEKAHYEAATMSEAKADYAYTDNAEEWSAFEEAKAAVDELFGRKDSLTDSDNEDIGKKTQALRDAMSAVPKLNFEDLIEKIRELEGKIKEAFTAQSWTDSMFEQRLEEARNMRDAHENAEGQQKKIDDAAADLQTASEALRERADYSGLEKALEDAKEKQAGKTQSDFTSGWDAFDKALKAAEQFMAEHPEEGRENEEASALEEQITQLAEELSKATEDLTPAAPEAADYGKYNEALAAAKAAKRSDYKVSDEVWNAFQKAIDDIDKALAKDLTKADQQKVDDAVKAIEAEVAKLGSKVSGSTGTGGGYSGGSGYRSSYSTYTGGSTAPAGSVTGNWTYDAAKDKWTFNDHAYRNQWVYAYNSYAAASQNAADWFYFDANGEMVTGWFTDADGYVYYLNPVSDNTRGRMVSGWNWITGEDGQQRCYYFNEVHDGHFGGLVKDTVTPDGYTVDASGAWTVNGIVAVR